MHASELIGKALKHIEQEEFAEAEEASKRVTDIDPENAHVWFHLGSALSGQNKYAEAENASRQATDIDPRYAMAWTNLGGALSGQGKYAEAEPLMRRALAGKEAQLGSDHLDTLPSVGNLAHDSNTVAAGNQGKMGSSTAEQDDDTCGPKIIPLDSFRKN